MVGRADHLAQEKTMEKQVSDCALGSRRCNPVLRPERGRQGKAPARGRSSHHGGPRLAASGPVFGAELGLQKGRKASPVTCTISGSFSATTCSTHHCSWTTGEAKRKNKWLWRGLEHSSEPPPPPTRPPSGAAPCAAEVHLQAAPSGKKGGFQVRFLRAPRSK